MTRIAIVGCGRIAQRHAEQIKRFGQLAAVCDIVKERVSELSERFDIPGFLSLDEMLASGLNFDVVSVCTPNGLHAEHSIKALKSGHHVLCEKPMALHSSDCLAMIKEASDANRLLYIVKQNRFNLPVQAVKSLLDQNRLGNIFSVQLNCFWNREESYYENSWRGTRSLDGGTLYTQFSHFIDLLYWFFGEVESVMARTGNYRLGEIIEFEDTGVALLKFQSGVIASLHYTVNAFKKNMEGSLTIFAEKGTIKIGGQYLNELEYQSLDGAPIGDLPAGNPPNNYGQYYGSMSNHDKIYMNLIAALDHQKGLVTNAGEALKTVEIIEMIYKAAQKNQN